MSRLRKRMLEEEHQRALSEIQPFNIPPQCNSVRLHRIRFDAYCNNCDRLMRRNDDNTVECGVKECPEYGVRYEELAMEIDLDKAQVNPISGS